MAFEIPDHFHSTFTANVELLLQQKESLLGDLVTVANYSGESAQVVKQFGEVEFVEKQSRNVDTAFSTIAHKQRWVFPSDFTLALPVDKEDEIRMLDSPLSPYAQAMQAAWNRKKDQVIANAFFGSSQTGVNGGTATTFPAGNIVAITAGASADTGLNVEKLIQVKELAIAAEVDLASEQLCCAVTGQQVGDLLRSLEVRSADYNDVRALVNGEVDTFMGIKFRIYERWGSNANSGSSSSRKIPVWVKSGMHLGMWNSLETKIGERADKEYLTQVFMRGTLGATRTQEDKVFQILCTEA
jgi:hypothetical protein